MIKAIKGTPWDPISSEKLSVNMGENAEQPKDVPAPPEVGMKFPRRLKITKEDIRRFGYTPGCQGCIAIAARKTVQGHNDKCRDRIQARLEQDDEGQARVEKRRHMQHQCSNK